MNLFLTILPNSHYTFFVHESAFHMKVFEGSWLLYVNYVLIMFITA